MHFEGILIGVLTFLIIGIFHPIVIKAEYYFSKKVWPIFAVVGIVFFVLSIMAESTFVGTVLAVFGASSLWSIQELFEQEKRVEKGWFPENPNRKDKGKE